MWECSYHFEIWPASGAAKAPFECQSNGPISQIPECICFISQNATFRTEMCTHFCSQWSILGYGTGAFWDVRIKSFAKLETPISHLWEFSLSFVLHLLIKLEVQAFTHCLWCGVMNKWRIVSHWSYHNVVLRFILCRAVIMWSIFSQIFTKDTPIACPLGQGMGCYL